MFETNDFPNFPTIDGKNSFDVNAGILGRSLKKIYPSIDTNNPKYELNGALIDVKEGFLNFDRKYLDFSRSGAIEPAQPGAPIKEKMQSAFTRLYNAGSFEGALIRCDFFERDGEIYLNEINPNPGSLANYLFDDFAAVLNALASSLPVMQHIPVSYELITKITANK